MLPRRLPTAPDEMLSESRTACQQTREASQRAARAAVVLTPAGHGALITGEAVAMMRCLAVGSK